MAFTGDFSALLLLLAAAAMKTAWSERYPRETMSGGPLSDSPKCVSGFCLQKGYQKLDLPTGPDLPESPNTVGIETQILDILEVNDKEFSITLTMFFVVSWDEPRLVSNVTYGPDESVPVDMRFLDHLWVPNIFIYDLRSFAPLNVLKKLAGVWITGGKNIMFNQACTVTFLCPMRFDLYPLDSHICKFRVGSTNFDDKYMKFSETSWTFDDNARNTILDYSINLGKIKEEDRLLQYGEMGNFSITGIEIAFIRHKFKYVYVYYLPSGLFVITSWASFLIPPEVVPGRMAMLITLFLVLINIFNSVTSISPNVEGMTAISAWMIVCILFVFAALAGYAYLLWRKKKSMWKTALRQRKSRLGRDKLTDEEGKLRQKRKEEIRGKIDDIFFLVFPLLFLIFNILYWPACLLYVPSG